MKTKYTAWAAAAASLLVAACGGGGSDSATGTQNSNPGRGGLVQSPPLRVTSLTAADYNSALSATSDGQKLLALSVAGTSATTLPCGVDVQYLKYGTVGGKGEAATATGALMVPTGTTANCTGPRPILLFAHGTTVEQRYNLADFADKTNPAYSQAQLLASMFAAQGYIVVAPNYAGYDASNLGYHPFLVASQQSKDMIDALTAAKAALPTLLSPTTASSKLFISGYSQGGHVALATLKAMQDAGMAVTAVAPLSGPYALGLYGDAIVGGKVPAGSTQLMPMVINGYQKTYGTLYSTPTDFYESTYASKIESAFPGPYTFTSLVTSAVVPELALFSSTAPAGIPGVTPPTTGGNASLYALWAAGFGTSNLIKNSVRSAYLADAATNPDSQATTPAATPAHPLRVALKANDLRTFTTTTKPLLFCGGSSDPTVYYVNTQLMAASITAPIKTVFDVDDSTTNANAGFDQLRLAFKSALAKVQSDAAAAALAAGGSASDAQTAAGKATLSYYHGGVAPYCTAAARGFFANF